MFIWHVRSARLYSPKDYRASIAESVHYELTGHAVGHYNPEIYLQDKIRSDRASMMHSAHLDIDPTKPSEQEQERVMNWAEATAAKADDYVLLMEVEAGIPSEEFNAIRAQLGVGKPTYKGAPDTFDSVDELEYRLQMQESEPNGPDYTEFNQLAEQLRDYVRDNPPMPEYGQALVGSAKRGEWLKHIVAPWVLNGYEGLPYGVEVIAASPNYEDICQECAAKSSKRKGPRDPIHRYGTPEFTHPYVAPKKGDAILLNSPPHSIWVVGKGVYQLPYRKNGKVVATFADDWRKKSAFKMVGQASGSEMPGQLTARARQEIEGKIFDFVTGIYQGSQNHRDELIKFIKSKLGIQPGTKLHELVFGDYDENVQIHQFPGAQQGEGFQLKADETKQVYYNIVIGVTIKLGDSGILNRTPKEQSGTSESIPTEKQRYLLGYLASVSANPENYSRLWAASKILQHKKSGSNTPRPADEGLTDIFALDTGLDGLAKIYGAINQSGQMTHHTFGTVKTTFEEILQKEIIGIAPGTGTCELCDGSGRLGYKPDRHKQMGIKPEDYKPGYEPGYNAAQGGFPICPECRGQGTVSPSAKKDEEGHVVWNPKTNRPADNGPYYGVKGAFKEIRVRNNGQILLIFAKPEIANPIRVDPELRNKEGYVCKSCGELHADAEEEYKAHYGKIFGIEGDQSRPGPKNRPVLNPGAVARGEAPIYGFIPPQPETMPRTPQNLQKYAEAQKAYAAAKAKEEQEAGISQNDLGPEFAECSTCNASGYTYKPIPQQDGTNKYEAVKCTNCEGQGRRRLRPPVDNTKRGQDKAARLKAASLWNTIKNDVLARVVMFNINKKAETGKRLTPRQKDDFIIEMAHYIRARNAKEEYERRKAAGEVSSDEEQGGELTTDIPYFSDELDAKGNPVPHRKWAYWIDLDNTVGQYAPKAESDD